jgi:hypothetical protein
VELHHDRQDIIYKQYTPEFEKSPAKPIKFKINKLRQDKSCCGIM